jgi:hypothetical protein
MPYPAGLFGNPMYQDTQQMLERYLEQITGVSPWQEPLAVTATCGCIPPGNPEHVEEVAGSSNLAGSRALNADNAGSNATKG